MLEQRDHILSQLCAQNWPYQPLLGALSLPIEASVLDVGAGAGGLLRELRGQGHAGRLVGVDSVPKWPEVLCSDAATLPFADATFDYVILLRVLPHLPQPERALYEAQRVLKAGGCLVVAQNGPQHLARFWTKVKGIEERGAVSHKLPLLQGFEYYSLSLTVQIDTSTALLLASSYNLEHKFDQSFTDVLALDIWTQIKS